MADELFRIESDSPAASELMFWSVLGHESLSRASHYELTVLSRNSGIDAAEVLGHAFDVAIGFRDPDQAIHWRHCQGHAVRFLRARQAGRYFEYRITLRSWFWLLTKRRNSRIFQDKPVLEVLDAVFEDSPIKRFRKVRPEQVIDTHEPHRYCVQFDESDYQFLSRLLEEEGVYYWFDAHEAPGTMHLADTSSVAHEKLPVRDTLSYLPSDRGEARYNEITHWVVGEQLQSGSHVSRDSDYKAIRRGMQFEVKFNGEHELTGFEDFAFAGDYFRAEAGEIASRVRAESIVAKRNRHWAVTGWPDVAVGRSFLYQGDPHADRNGEYLIGACTFAICHPGYEGLSPKLIARAWQSAFAEMLADDAFNEPARHVLQDLVDSIPAFERSEPGTQCFLLSLLPAGVSFKPPALTPRVRMPGPLSALVVGPDGEPVVREGASDLHVDDTGARVKLQFHWDRYNATEHKSTCWVRVSQPWAGQGWGAQFMPRIGQEVIVDFINGDPDRPVVTGRVYNDDQRPLYKSPTQSGFRSRSTPGGKEGNYNEIMFEDRKGAEVLAVHAERNMSTSVEVDDSTTVGHDQALAVGNDRNHRVRKKEHITIGERQEIEVGSNGQKITIEGNQESYFKGFQRVEVDKNRQTWVKGFDGHYVDLNYDVEVKGFMNTRVGKDASHQVQGNMRFDTAGARTDSTGAEHHLMAKKVTIFAAEQDIDIIAAKNVNLAAEAVNQFVFGDLKTTTGSSSSTFEIGASRKTSISASAENNISAKLENALGVELRNSISLSMENKIALEISNVGGLELKNTMFGTERTSLKFIQPAPDSGSSSSASSAPGTPQVLAQGLVFLQGLWSGYDNARHGFDDFRETVDAEKNEIRSKKEEITKKLEMLREEARKAGRGELEEKLGELQRRVDSRPVESSTEKDFGKFQRVAEGALRGAAIGGVAGPAGVVPGGIAGGIVGMRASDGDGASPPSSSDSSKPTDKKNG